jgi:hypothetical protein
MWRKHRRWASRTWVPFSSLSRGLVPVITPEGVALQVLRVQHCCMCRPLGLRVGPQHEGAAEEESLSSCVPITRFGRLPTASSLERRMRS